MKETLDGKIAKARIPDEDVSGWMQSLREGGMTDDEIDIVLINLNKTYAEHKGLTSEVIAEQQLMNLEQYLAEKHRRHLSEEQREYYRKVFKEKWEQEEQ